MIEPLCCLNAAKLVLSDEGRTYSRTCLSAFKSRPLSSRWVRLVLVFSVIGWKSVFWVFLSVWAQSFFKTWEYMLLLKQEIRKLLSTEYKEETVTHPVSDTELTLLAGNQPLLSKTELHLIRLRWFIIIYTFTRFHQQVYLCNVCYYSVKQSGPL